MSQNFHTSYVETLGKLETQYCKLKVSFDLLTYIVLWRIGPSKQRFPNSESTWFRSVLVFFLLDYNYCVIIQMDYNTFFEALSPHVAHAAL